MRVEGVVKVNRFIVLIYVLVDGVIEENIIKSLKEKKINESVLNL